MDFEGFVIEIITESDVKNVVVTVVYRPPLYSKNFYEVIENVIATLSVNNKNIIIAGDFNIELTSATCENNTLLQIMEFHGLNKTIDLPTRITSNKKSIIDNIFYNSSQALELCGVLNSDISDHHPIFIQICLRNHSKPKKFNFAPSKNFSHSSSHFNKLCYMLCAIDWTDVYLCDDLELAWNNFINNFQNSYKECCEISNMKKIKKNAKTKILDDERHKKIIKEKNKFYKKFLKNPSKENLQKFKSFNKM